MWQAAGERARPIDLVWVIGPVLACFVTVLLAPVTIALAAWLTMFAAMIVGPIVWVRRRAPRDPWWPGGGTLLGESTVGLVMLGAVSFYSLLITYWTGPSEASGSARLLGEGAGEGASPIARLLFIIAISVGPVAEELFYRGFLLHALQRWMPRLIALLMQAVAFAAVHNYDWSGTLTMAGVGLLLGGLVMWRHGIIGAIVAHIGVNGYAAIEATRGEAPRPIIGVRCKPGPGCTVMDAPTEGPAYREGLREGDVITRFMGMEVDSNRHLVELVQTYGRPGQLVQLEVETEGVSRLVLVRLGISDP